MTDERKKQLFPDFAIQYAKQLDPEKYGSIANAEELFEILQYYPEDKDSIINKAEQMNDSDWEEFGVQIDYAKNGMKFKAIYLNELQKFKSGGKTCKCGCKMVMTKEQGGKLSSKCACGCKVKKKQTGGNIETLPEKPSILRKGCKIKKK